MYYILYTIYYILYTIYYILYKHDYQHVISCLNHYISSIILYIYSIIFLRRFGAVFPSNCQVVFILGLPKTSSSYVHMVSCSGWLIMANPWQPQIGHDPIETYINMSTRTHTLHYITSHYITLHTISHSYIQRTIDIITFIYKV